jgi:hypothetical protein
MDDPRIATDCPQQGPKQLEEFRNLTVLAQSKGYGRPYKGASSKRGFRL